MKDCLNRGHISVLACSEKLSCECINETLGHESEAGHKEVMRPYWLMVFAFLWKDIGRASNELSSLTFSSPNLSICPSASPNN
jgi:hypothetical protein